MKDLFEVLKETLNTSSKGLGNTGTTNGAPATRQALRFSVKSMSNGYVFPNNE